MLVIEWPAIVGDSTERIRDLLEQSGARAAVVVYRFGARRHIETLRSSGIMILRAPAEITALQDTVARWHTDLSSPPSTTPAVLPATGESQQPPRFSRDALAKMAMSNPMATCECQKNLVDVVLSLSALEEYLDGCESVSPEEEMLHRVLGQKVAAARSNIEDAIEHFAEVEGIVLPR